MISSEFQEFPAESTAEQVYEEPKNEAKDEYYFDESGDNTPFDMSLIRQDHNLTLRLKQRIESISPSMITAIIDRLHMIEATADDAKNLYRLQEGLMEAIDNLETDMILNSVTAVNPVKQTCALSHLAKSTLLKGERHVVVGVCFAMCPTMAHWKNFGETLRDAILSNKAFNFYEVQLEVRPSCLVLCIPYGGKEMQLLVKPSTTPTGLNAYKTFAASDNLNMDDLIAKEVIYECNLEASQISWLHETLRNYPANGRSVKDFCLIWRDLRVRFPSVFGGFTDWLIENFAIHCLYNVSFTEGDFGPRHKRVTKLEVPGLQLPAAIKRSLQLVATGFFMPQSIGLADPILPGNPKIHLKSMSLDEMDAACAGAQTALRMIALDQSRLIFGLGRKIVNNESYDVSSAPNDDGLLLQQSSINGFMFEPSMPMREMAMG